MLSFSYAAAAWLSFSPPLLPKSIVPKLWQIYRQPFVKFFYRLAAGRFQNLTFFAVHLCQDLLFEFLFAMGFCGFLSFTKFFNIDLSVDSFFDDFAFLFLSFGQQFFGGIVETVEGRHKIKEQEVTAWMRMGAFSLSSEVGA